MLLPPESPDATATLLYTHPVVAWPASDPLVTAVGGTQLALLYALSAAHAPGLVDVTTGNNTVSFLQNLLVTVQGYHAGPGYDLASGVGTIDAALFVPELAQAASGGYGG